MANLVKHRFQSAKTDGADATQIQPSNWNDGHVFSGGNAGDQLTRDPTDATYGAKWTTPTPPPPGLPSGGNLGDLLTKDATVPTYLSKWAAPLTTRPSGGAAGQMLICDPTDATYGSKWAAPPVGTPPGGNLNDVLTKDASVATYGAKWVTPTGITFTAQPYTAGDYSAGGGMTFTPAAGDVQVNRYAIFGKLLIWQIAIQGTGILGGTAGYDVTVKFPGARVCNVTMNAIAYVVDNGATQTGFLYYNVGGSTVNFRRLPATPWTTGAVLMSVGACIVVETQ